MALYVIKSYCRPLSWGSLITSVAAHLSVSRSACPDIRSGVWQNGSLLILCLIQAERDLAALRAWQGFGMHCADCWRWWWWRRGWRGLLILMLGLNVICRFTPDCCVQLQNTTETIRIGSVTEDCVYKLWVNANTSWWRKIRNTFQPFQGPVFLMCLFVLEPNQLDDWQKNNLQLYR